MRINRRIKISILILGIGLEVTIALPILAQNITLDGTLGEAKTLTGPNYTIRQQDGQTVGNNLFQSFGRFGLNAKEAAIFQSNPNIQNILSRVTGGFPSFIDGLIKTESASVNLFLINPSGIIFGANASLNVNGSFVATSANAIQFGDKGFFSATEPNSPALLTVNPSALFFNQIQAGKITNQSKVFIGIDEFKNEIRGLQVPDGKSLLLVGGDIVIDGGGLNALGGRIELASVEGTGTVGLDVNGSELSLNVPDELARADVSIINGSLLKVDASDGGSIAVNARNLAILEESFLVAGIGTGLGSVDSQAGDVMLNASEVIRIEQFSSVRNEVFLDGIGNAGNILISAKSLSVIDGSQLRAITSGQGNSGNMIINAKDTVTFSGSLNGAISLVSPTAQGRGGVIRINTRILSVFNGSQLQATTYGRGDAGKVIINAHDTVFFDGGDDQGFVSGIFNDVNQTGVGRGGDIFIRTGSLYLTNGAEMSASTYGKGDAGDVTIEARDTVVIRGLKIFDEENILSSGIFSNIQEDAQGNGGTIQITTGSFVIADDAELDVSPRGQGDGGSVVIDARDTALFDRGNIFSNVVEGATGQGGNVRINAGSISLINRAEIQASTEAQGDAGDVILTARDTISFDGVGTSPFQSGLFPSGIFSEVEETGQGTGGDIVLTSRAVYLTNGAQLVAITRGQGNAGRIIIDARDVVSIDGIGTNELPSGFFTLSQSSASGQAGDININTSSFSIADGAIISASTLNSQNGGNISLNTQQLTIQNGATITASSEGTGNAGNILNITARNLTLDNGSITTTSLFGNGGNIENLQVRDLLLLRNQSQISTTAGAEASGGGNGGNININAGFIVAVPDENSDITANAFAGSGGNITISTNGIFGLTFRNQPTPQSDITASSRFGINGIIAINTPDVNPLSALDTLPINPVDAEKLVAQNVCAIKDSKIAGGSSFIITGKGGLPPNPNETLTNLTGIVEWATNDRSQTRIEKVPVIVRSRSQTHQPELITPIQGWVKNSDGTVTLTTTASTVTPQSPSFTPQDCSTAS